MAAKITRNQVEKALKVQIEAGKISRFRLSRRGRIEVFYNPPADEVRDEVIGALEMSFGSEYRCGISKYSGTHFSDCFDLETRDFEAERRLAEERAKIDAERQDLWSNAQTSEADTQIWSQAWITVLDYTRYQRLIDNFGAVVEYVDPHTQTPNIVLAAPSAEDQIIELVLSSDGLLPERTIRIHADHRLAFIDRDKRPCHPVSWRCSFDGYTAEIGIEPCDDRGYVRHTLHARLEKSIDWDTRTEAGRPYHWTFQVNWSSYGSVPLKFVREFNDALNYTERLLSLAQTRPQFMIGWTGDED